MTGRVRAALTLSTFLCMTLPCMAVQQFFLLAWPSMAARFPQAYHKRLAKILGVKVNINGCVPEKGPALIVANHVSWLDIVILSTAAKLSFVAKREVGTWPLFGSLARLQRSVFIERDRRHATGTGRDEMKTRLANGDVLVLFAEGTSGDGNSVLPFKSAYFGAADLEGVAIHPCTIAYSGHRNLPMNRRMRPFYAWYGDMELPIHLWEAVSNGPIEVDLIFHEPRKMTDPKARKEIARDCEADVRRGLSLALHRRRDLR
jgi:1-acyl-sn-glycerol-3-phosphate acyltransferase